ncbi:MAG: NAD(P)/FAD-dependent oxidoreductase [Halobacteriota archaeon]|uniref:NAD(P)/FAD-dependent oxidoreductase n=1 Tax=Natronomonas sp. TaxID=2184060 RepID=UPI003974C1B2
MSDTANEADVVIVGGGVSGCAIARELATDHDVVLVEKSQVASEASALAAGIIGISVTYDRYPAIGAHAARFFEDLDGTGQFSYTRRGSVRPVPPEKENDLRMDVEYLRGEGHDVTFREAADLPDRYPWLNSGPYAGAIEYPAEAGKGWTDPYTLAVTLKEQAEKRGATIVTNTNVREILTEANSISGVRTDSGVVCAPNVVVAAGWRTPRLLDDLVEVPVRPYRTQVIVLDPGVDVRGWPMGDYGEEHVYWRPENNGHLLIGGHSFPTDTPTEASRDEDESFRQHVASVVPKIFSGLAGAEFVDGWAGVDAATPDTYPIIDAPDDAPDGLVVATGFNGRGVMTAPVTGVATRALVTGKEPPFPLDPFGIDRFDSRSSDFEFVSISSAD